MRAALIGLGMVADTHVLAIRDNSAEVTLSGVLGRDGGRAATFAQKCESVLGHGVVIFEDINAVVAGCDFAILATPPNARLDLVKALAAAGRPILMEKPIERDLARATEIVEICEAANVPLGIVFQHRVRAASRALAEAIQDGVLGDIATVDIRVPWWRDQSYYDEPGRGSYGRDGGGVMISQAIHTLDLALSLLGPVHSVQAQMRRTPLHNLEAEDWATALLEFESGAIGVMSATTADFPGGTESIRIQGTKANAHLEAGILTLNHLDRRTEEFGASAATGGGADPMAFTHDWHMGVLEDFAQAIKENRAPLCSGREALAVHRVIDAMERAAKSAGKVKL